MSSVGRFLRHLRALICERGRSRSLKDEWTYVKSAALEMECCAVGDGVAGIVFSMDRAMQLDALLWSYRDNVGNAPKLTIIFRSTNDRHLRAYEDVFAEHCAVIGRVVCQESRGVFKELVVEEISRINVERIFFLVDDNLFIEPVDVYGFSNHASMYAVPTLRLGENLKTSYTVQKSQKMPSLESYFFGNEGTGGREEIRSWRWSEGELDWGYPLSVDGHIFQRNEILAIAKAIDFDSPNTFEGTLQKFNFAFQWRLGVCYRKSKLINIPYNRVQSDFENIHGEIHQDEMLKMWEDGYRIDRTSYYGFVNESAHQELPLRLRKAESK